MSDRENLIEQLKANTCPALTFEDCMFCRYDGMKDCLQQSQADHLIANGVVVRKKGEWIRQEGAWRMMDSGENVNIHLCSCCGGYFQNAPYNFCPACGADMRGELK